jgi:hypothetical protein
VTFDLSELRFISSLAMGVLVVYRRAAVHAGTRVCLAAGLHPEVREALDRAGLLDLFEVVEDPKAWAESVTAAEESRTLVPKGNGGPRTDEVLWWELIELEPQLKALLWRARMAGSGCRTSAEAQRAFAPLRNELAGLLGFVGKHHRHPVLGSARAYAVASGRLYDAVAALLPARAAGAQVTPETQGGDRVAERSFTESAAEVAPRA